MCVRCGSLIKAIDAYIEKKENDLEETLDNEGFVESKKSLKASRKIEDEIAALLTAETSFFIKKITIDRPMPEFASFRELSWQKNKNSEVRYGLRSWFEGKNLETLKRKFPRI